MRDVIVLGIVLVGVLAALRRPWIGVMLWTWLSIMNPHRYTYGIAFNAPVAAVAALSIFIGLLITKDERVSPFKNPAVTVFFLFIVWMNISWLNGLGVGEDYNQWNKVMKIDAMVLVGLMVLHRSMGPMVSLTWVA